MSPLPELIEEGFSFRYAATALARATASPRRILCTTDGPIFIARKARCTVLGGEHFLVVGF